MNTNDVKAEKIAAMKAKDSFRSATLGTVLAAIKQHEVDNRVEVDEATLINILNRMVKQRQESISQFTAANRLDLVVVEENELAIIKAFLPVAASDEEIEAVVNEAIASEGKNMGAVMKIVKAKLNGKADMKKVNDLVKAKLA